MRNIPPRPDNYAQRGGRAGRRARIGLVVSYANRRPHDQYFYDHPEEMIAGEVPTPTFSLLNRDVLLRHVAAIAFGAANPGLAGQMVIYVTVDGQVQQESVDGLKAAVTATTEHTVELAQRALGMQLAAAGVDEAGLRAYLASLPERIQGVVDRTARQVLELRQSIERWAEGLQQGQRHLAIRAETSSTACWVYVTPPLGKAAMRTIDPLGTRCGASPSSGSSLDTSSPRSRRHFAF